MEEEQTTQWPKEKEQKDKQRSTKHTYKTEIRVINIQYYYYYTVIDVRTGNQDIIVLSTRFCRKHTIYIIICTLYL
jgi:hypothetical protein